MAWVPVGVPMVVLRSLSSAPASRGVLGPFATGDVVRRVGLTITTDGSSSLVFAASLGISNESSNLALAAGISLVRESTSSIQGTPGVIFDPRVAGMFSAELWAGWRVREGPMFMPVVFFASTTVAALCNVSLLVERWADVPGGDASPNVRSGVRPVDGGVLGVLQRAASR